MTLLEMKQQMHTMVDSLSEIKLALALDFLQFLAQRDTAAELLWIQMHSDAYREWLGEENDVYDRVFANESAG